MKTLCLIALIAVTAGTAARAASSTNAPPQMRLTDIYSDGSYYDGKTQKVTYHDNVRVIGSDMRLSCELLVADSPQSGGRLSHVVAETNVVFDATNVVVDSKNPIGRTVHVTGQKAVYDYSVQNGVTNEMITITGVPQPQAIIYQGAHIETNTADVITWDRANNVLRFSGNQRLQIFTEELDTAPANTNAPAATTNKLTATKIDLLPGTDTNYPPGSLDRAFPGGSGGRGF